MTQKRPFNEEVVNEVSSKHPRQDGAGSEIISCNNISIEGLPPNPCELGEASIEKNKTVFQGRESSGFPDTVRESVNDIGTDVPRSASIFYWATRCASGEDGPSEEIIHLPFFPEYFSYDRPVRSAISPDDVYHCLLDYPPRKRVPIGPEHQAEIPGCSTHGNVIASFGLEKSEPEASDRTIDDIDDSELQGICIISSPAIEPPSYDGKVGDGRTDCICLDQGSVRCVRQHIIEARDKLRRTLGQGALMELGFYDMGEVVAEKWSEEEEQLFHEVVYSNPASLGRNFWNALSAVFPCRTKMEIVSYYFNVFMLRKRAEQNRCDPMNIDSDNDEWQGSDDDGGVSEEEEEEDEDEDSGVESPVVHNGLELHADEDDEQEGVDGNTSIDEAQEGNENYDDEGYDRKSPLEQQRKKMDEEGEENNGQDGSCTSSDSGVGVQGGGGGELKPEGCKEWHEYIVESCNATGKGGGGGGWDGYDDMSCFKSNEDLLPTCTMIEEVFGNGGDLDSKTNRW